MLYCVTVLCALLAFASARGDKFEHKHFKSASHAKTFAKWQKHFGKTYDSIEEESHRFAVFLSNWEQISAHNDKGLSWSMNLNQFGDLSGKEFKTYVHGHEGSCLHGVQKKVLNREANRGGKLLVNAPAAVDWTAKGMVTAVKNQGQCGSCWAFSTTGSIESASAIAGKALTPLSEQQLVDCSGSYGNNGCNGGLMDDAFKYVEASGGLCSESEYPYKAKDGTCKSSTCGTKYDPISGYTDVTADSASSMEAAVAKGPVSIAIEADQQAFQFYSGGVLAGTCGTQLDHGVLAVGYGSASGKDFWKVKNSWGASWGEAGYIRLCRNCGKNGGAGECGILDDPSYPTAK